MPAPEAAGKRFRIPIVLRPHLTIVAFYFIHSLLFFDLPSKVLYFFESENQFANNFYQKKSRIKYMFLGFYKLFVNDFILLKIQTIPDLSFWEK